MGTDDARAVENETSLLRRARWRLLLVVALLLVVPFAGIRVARNLRFVPPLTGLPLREAEARARSYGLDPSGEPELKGDPGQVPLDIVTAQRPSSWRLTWGTHVYLKVVTGPARVPVPDVRGLHPFEAANRLQVAWLGFVWQEGLAPGIFHHGRVVMTRPEAGQLASRSVPVSIELTGTPRPWDHAAAVAKQGASTCFGEGCHSPVYCGACHLRKDRAKHLRQLEGR